MREVFRRLNSQDLDYRLDMNVGRIGTISQLSDSSDRWRLYC